VLLHSKGGQDYLSWCLTNGAHLFGHGRYATSGKISVENAHPFQEGDWILVHNGSVRGGGLKTGGVGEPEVDSHALCVRINEVGLKEALQSIDGAFAIIAYNTKERKVYAARNKERPLHYFRQGKHAYLASTYAGLQFSLQDNGKFLDDKMKYIEELKADSLYVLTENGFEEADSVKKLPPPPPPPVYAGAGGGGYSRPNYDASTYAPLPQEGEVLVFTAWKSYKVPGSTQQYLYKARGTSLAGGIAGKRVVDVIFRSDKDSLEYLDRAGKAPVHFREFHAGRYVYTVRFQDIVWATTEKTEEMVKAENDAIDGGLHSCAGCADPMELPKDGFKLVSGEYMCFNCIDDFRKTHGSFRNLELHQ
jgi:hypothetical protein